MSALTLEIVARDVRVALDAVMPEGGDFFPRPSWMKPSFYELKSHNLAARDVSSQSLSHVLSHMAAKVPQLEPLETYAHVDQDGRIVVGWRSATGLEQ